MAALMAGRRAAQRLILPGQIEWASVRVSGVVCERRPLLAAMCFDDGDDSGLRGEIFILDLCLMGR